MKGLIINVGFASLFLVSFTGMPAVYTPTKDQVINKLRIENSSTLNIIELKTKYGIAQDTVGQNSQMVEHP